MTRFAKAVAFAPVFLVIKGLPASKKTGQRQIHAKGRVIPIPSAKYVSYEKAACVQLAQQFTGPPIDQPCHLEARFHRDNRTDVDNLLGGLFDILQKGKVIKNDRLIYSVTATKSGACDGNPRVVLTLSPLQETK